MMNLDSPPPLWWRRFERAYIVVLAPSITALLSNIVENDHKLALFTGLGLFSVAIVKFIGMMIGSDVNYADLPSNGKK